MNMFYNKLCAWIFVFTLLGVTPGSIMALSSSNPLIKMDSSNNIVAVWITIDGFGNPILQGSTLPNGETVWAPPTNFSQAIGDNIINNTPSMYSNENGDVAVVWQYVDLSTFNYFIAAAILPVGGSTWNITTVSLSTENASKGDQRLEMNNSGNLALMWTSTTSGNSILRMSTSTVGPSTTWTTPVTVPNS